MKRLMNNGQRSGNQTGPILHQTECNNFEERALWLGGRVGWGSQWTFGRGHLVQVLRVIALTGHGVGEEAVTARWRGIRVLEGTSYSKGSNTDVPMT